jgi:hypothetical protein
MNDMDEMLDQMIAMLRTMLKRDELFEIGAQMVKKSYDAMIKAGFTEDQALKIVAGQGSPLNMKSK